jgi:D-psicose/D-tagatose/L-ribulose 3-epimerase
MKLGLINSAWSQAGKGTEFGIVQTKRVGFDTIDIQADPLDLDVRERKLIRDVAQREKLPIKSVCCVATGLCDFNYSVQRFSVDRVRQYLDFCYELQADNLLLVLGEYIWERQVIPPAEQWKTAVNNTQECSRYARTLGLEIAIELEPFKLSLVNSIDTMLQFLDDVGSPYVKANCDISHLHLVNAPPRDVQRLKGQIAHVHLSDCNGQTHGDLPPGRGITPLKDYLAQIQETGFDKTVSIELEYSPQPERIVEWVEEAYRQTDKIMRELGCRG